MNSSPEVVYILDADADGPLDADLRILLRTCFTKPEDQVFQRQRYVVELPKHRWTIREADGRLVGHVAAHEKEAICHENTYRVAGIAEVCVHPDGRRRGYVKALLAAAHAWLPASGYHFAVLFGDPDVYGSSGYSLAQNVVMMLTDDAGRASRTTVQVLVRPLADIDWPTTEVFIPGPVF